MGLFKKKKEDEPEKTSTPLREHPVGNNLKVVFNSRRLVPVVVQDVTSREVLKLGYMDRWALDVSLDEAVLYLYRRSSQKLVKFGENKGLEYEIKSVKLENSKRSLLFEVLPSIPQSSESNFIYQVFPDETSNRGLNRDIRDTDSESW